MIKIRKKEFILNVLIVFFSVFTTVLCCISKTLNGNTKLIAALPICFIVGIVLFLMISNEIPDSIAFKTFVAVYFVRLVITPFFMSVEKTFSILPINLYTDSIAISIFVICYEWIFVTFLLGFYYRRKKVELERSIINEGPSFGIWFVIILICIYFLLIYSMDKGAFESAFLSIIKENKNEMFDFGNTGAGTVHMHIGFVESLFTILQVLLPPSILFFIKTSKIPTKLKYVVSIVLCSLVAIIATEARIYSIFAAIALLITMKDYFGEKFELVYKISIFAVAGVALFGLLMKSGVVGDSLSGHSISTVLNAYFSGIPTVATGIEFIKIGFGFNPFVIGRDILSKVPYFAMLIFSLFDSRMFLNNCNIEFNEFICNNLGRNIGQILPTTVLGYIYFGILLFPLLTFFMVIIADKLENKGKRSSNLIMRHLFNWITIGMAASPIVGSALLIVTRFSWFVFIYILVCISERHRLKIRT